MEVKSELLSGKVIIKVQLGDDIRRIPIHNEAITYDELVLMMQRIFNGKLSAKDDITIKYKDEDGDLITIFDSSDLSFAIQCSNILKLQILKPSLDVGSETNVTNASCNISNIKTQLRKIRDQVNCLLDDLDVGASGSSASAAENHVDSDNNDTAPVSVSNAINKVNSSEFDPLQEKNKEELKEPAEVSQSSNKEVPENIPHPAAVAPTPPIASNVPSQIPHEYYGNTATTGYHQQMPYGNVPYPQQYSYPSAGYGQPIQHADHHTQGPPSTNPYVSTSQASLPYSNQPPQQGYNPPPTGYPTQAQTNPYSKNYTQPSPSHGYMQR